MKYSYWYQIIWVFIAGILFYGRGFRKTETVLGKREKRWTVFAAIAMMIPLILLAGYRPYAYGDTIPYMNMYKNAPYRISEWSQYLSRVKKDKGFSVLILLIKFFVRNSSVIFFIIIASIQLVILALFYRKYSYNYWFSVFVFVASTDYMSWVHNGVRQFVAATIVLIAFSLFIQKKYIRAFLVVGFASLFHLSALIVIPILLISLGKAWNWRTLLIILASTITLVFINRFTSLLDNLLSDTQYENVVSDWTSWHDDGTHPLRVLVYSVPMIISIFGYRYIKESNDPVINLSVNASIITTVLYLLSMRTSGIFMGRLPIYVSMLATGIALPWEIEHIFEERSAKYITALAVVFYLAFFYYQMHRWRLL